MNTRYFNLEELSNYIMEDQIASDLTEGHTLTRCSIADLIDFCELQKKSRSTLPLTQLLERFELFSEDLELTGMVFVADLDQETLSRTLFVERNPSELWSGAATREIPPLHSVRRLSLKDRGWDVWEENVYVEMEEFFSEQLTNG